jgi:hypothetical protein
MRQRIQSYRYGVCLSIHEDFSRKFNHFSWIIEWIVVETIVIAVHKFAYFQVKKDSSFGPLQLDNPPL